MRLVLHACWAFLINSNDDQTHSLPDTSNQTPTQKRLPLSPICHCFCFSIVLGFFYYSLNPHYISFHSPSACHLRLLLTPLKAETLPKIGSRQSIRWNLTAFMSVTRTVSSWVYLAELWIVVLRDVSHSTCQCMNTAWKAERRPGGEVLGKSLQTFRCASGLIGKGLSLKHHS